MPLFTCNYQKTGFIYSVTLSIIYLPLLLGILESNMFIPNQLSNFFVFIIFFVVFITTVNYKIILTTKNKNSNFVNRFLLAPINFIIMLILAFTLPFSVQMNVLAFSLAFIGIPWLIFFIWIFKRHSIFCKRKDKK